MSAVVSLKRIYGGTWAGAPHGLAYEDVALWGIHEAFAAQALFHFKALEDSTFLRQQVGVCAKFGAFPRDRVKSERWKRRARSPIWRHGARILSQAVKELAATPAWSLAIVSIRTHGGQGAVALLEAV